MAQPAPAAPTHVLRSHTNSISTIYISDDNERIYSGDGSGLLVVTSTRSLRAVASWKAHSDGLLGVQEWEGRVVTHGRDNKLHIWKRTADAASINVGGSAALLSLPKPELLLSQDVNALNYCRFSLLPLSTASSDHRIPRRIPHKALISLPNLVDSSTADIWSIPDFKRLHAAIGQSATSTRTSLFEEVPKDSKTGILMSLHLYATPRSSPSSSTSEPHPTELRLLCAYENGSVTLWKFARADKSTSVEGQGWESTCTVKLHKEAIMAMGVAKNNRLALTVSADHLVGRYDLEELEEQDGSPEKACVVQRTKYPGNAAVALNNNGRVCAIGGWDGRIRLYSTKSFKPLGTLTYHKTGCQAVSFANSVAQPDMNKMGKVTSGDDEGYDDGEYEEEMSGAEIVHKSRWLVAGGKEGRVSIWELMSFER